MFEIPGDIDVTEVPSPNENLCTLSIQAKGLGRAVPGADENCGRAEAVRLGGGVSNAIHSESEGP